MSARIILPGVGGTDCSPIKDRCHSGAGDQERGLDAGRRARFGIETHDGLRFVCLTGSRKRQSDPKQTDCESAEVEAPAKHERASGVFLRSEQAFHPAPA